MQLRLLDDIPEKVLDPRTISPLERTRAKKKTAVDDQSKKNPQQGKAKVNTGQNFECATFKNFVFFTIFFLPVYMVICSL